MSVMMISLRDYTLRSTKGHVIAFKARNPRLVPDHLVSEALAVNIVPVDEYHPDGSAKAPEHAQKVRITGSLRDALAIHAIQDVIRENSSEDFNAGGQPKVGTLNARTGLKLSAQEASKYWDRYRELGSQNAELPTHPRMEQVLEAQKLSTRKDLEAYAKDLGLPMGPLQGKSLSALKEAVMYAAVNYNEATAAAPPPPGYKKPETLEED